MQTPTHSFWQSLVAFANNVFAPKLHILFAAFWSLSLLGNFVAVNTSPVWPFGFTTLLVVGSFFLVLFYLRMVDEVKDFEYDKIYNTDRPLVAGLITRPQLRLWMIVFAGTIITINYSMHAALACILILDMLYALFLIQLEKWSQRVQDGIFLNLAVTYPVNVTLSIYLLCYFSVHLGYEIGFNQVILVLAYALAFLHFEIARKSGWPHLTPASERLYSHEIGPYGALGLNLLLGIVAVVLLLSIFAPWQQQGIIAAIGWLPLLAWIPMGLGAVKFLRARQVRHKPRPMAVGYLMVFYATSLIHALAATQWQFVGW